MPLLNTAYFTIVSESSTSYRHKNIYLRRSRSFTRRFSTINYQVLLRKCKKFDLLLANETSIFNILRHSLQRNPIANYENFI